jgi:hypothetical protein
MRELVSPAQSEVLVSGVALLLTLIGAIVGWRVAQRRGLVAALIGPLVWVMWQGHKYVTRHDAATGYFGLDKVAVLAIEVVVFMALGLVLSAVWEKLSYQRDTVEARTETE